MMRVEADFILSRCNGRCHAGDNRKVSASAETLAKPFNRADGRSIMVVSAGGAPRGGVDGQREETFVVRLARETLEPAVPR